MLCELFGSPIIRSMAVFIGLMTGYLVACLTRYDGAAYVTTAPIGEAPWITFLWTTTFPYSAWLYTSSRLAHYSSSKKTVLVVVTHIDLSHTTGIWPAGLLPVLVGILINVTESIGDMTGTEETSLLETEGPVHDQRIAGGLLNDGFSTLLSGLAGALPTSCFARVRSSRS